MLKVENLKAFRENIEILKGINISIKNGEIHAIMGPNGSGKSTLASCLMGHPDIKISENTVIEMDKKNVMDMDVNERALEGLFLAFQYPVEIPGVPYLEFLRLAFNNKQKHLQQESYKEMSPIKFKRFIKEKINELKMGESFLTRNLNEGFSGGEKKKSEILQMAVLQPNYAILDETDSGLDVDALKIVGEGARKLAKEMKVGVLVITHYQRLLDYLKPDRVHVLAGGMLVKSGNADLASKLDKEGYDKYL